jgi:AraC-like DNA-binding protein
MKRVYLLRHAKSSWKHPELPDHDRPLAGRGKRAAKAMVKHMRAQEFEPELVLCSTARRALISLNREIDGSRSLSSGVPDAIPVYIHLLRAKDVIDREYARPLDVATLAVAAHASTAHFARSFKQAFGETPHKYLSRRRIERAKELLRGTDLSATDVSLEVGFQSLGSFSAAFRELVGESPGRYGRRWREEAAPPIPGCFTLMYTRPVGSSSFRED